MNKALKKKPYLREDKYAYIYNHYDFSLEDFILAFDEPTETYYYLEMICQTNRAKKTTLDDIFIDTMVAPEYRKKAERAIYKQYVRCSRKKSTSQSNQALCQNPLQDSDKV